MNPAGPSKGTSPLGRFAVHTTTTCGSQASMYGKCILASYTDVRKDMCKAEFALFAQCLRQAVRAQFLSFVD
ncbi:hypothetical protein C8F01DRAFT_995419 [Mycena amicta]|nr:hypothetical protein C8F01DRAFT_995419 [Mycena amicta]